MNGMSIKEIYDALDQRDRLVKALEKERIEHQRLKDAVLNAGQCVSNTAKAYYRCSVDSRASKTDKAEFRGRTSGLLEAHGYIMKALESPETNLA